MLIDFLSIFLGAFSYFFGDLESFSMYFDYMAVLAIIVETVLLVFICSCSFVVVRALSSWCRRDKS